MRHQRPILKEYLAVERGSQKKKWKDRLPIGLIFPSSYRVGMSNLGFQLVYDLLNQDPRIVCERIFHPEDGPPLSVESQRTLSDFPVLLCSISFEQNIPYLLTMLKVAGIALRSAERSHRVGPGEPLVVGGGVACFINPEPLAPFMDAMVIGEAEPVLPAMIEQFLDAFPIGDRQDFLAGLVSRVPAIYVPALYRYEYDETGGLRAIQAEAGAPSRIRRIGISGSPVVGHSRLLSPAAEFSDLFMVELGRGCSRGCRFCAAGFVYRPPRLWSAEAILAAVQERPEGVKRLGLLGMEMARRDDLIKVSRFLAEQGCLLSFSSLRADALNGPLLDLLAASGLKTAAIAPDGGSERLRRVINKGISEEDVLSSAEFLVKAGVMNLKLYFMIGLPTEGDDDLVELVRLVKKVLALMSVIGRSRGRLSTLVLSINPFVPKAWTPFQFHSFAGLKSIKQKLKMLRREMSGLSHLKIMGEKPERAWFQAILARGDRRQAAALVCLAGEGGNWRHTFKKEGIEPDSYCRPYRRDELLPWEIIDIGVSRQYLWDEYQRALAGQTTLPCKPKTCRRCGVCSDD